MLFLVCVFFVWLLFLERNFLSSFFTFLQFLCFATKKKSLDFCSLCCFCFVALLSSEQKRRRRRTERCSKDDRKKKKRARLRDDTRALWGSLLAQKNHAGGVRGERKSGVKTENFVTSPFKEKEQYYPQRRLKRRERERDKDE